MGKLFSHATRKSSRYWPHRLALLALVFFGYACAPSAEKQAELADIHEKQAAAYKKSGQFRAAIIEARNVIQKAPSEARGYVLLAGILNDLGQYKSALDVLAQLPDNSASDAAALTEIDALLGRGKFVSGLDVIERESQLADGHPSKYSYLRARALAGLDRDKEASAILDGLIKKDPNYADAKIALADLALKKEDVGTAKSLLGEVLESQPENVEAGALLAKIDIIAGDYAAAEKHLSDTLIKIPQADTITPQKATILSALSEVLVKQGRSAEALIYTRILADAFPGFEVAQEKYREAVALFEAGDLDGARTQLDELLSEFPNFENATVLSAIISYQQGNFDDAAAQLNQSVDPELVHPEITRITALSNLRSNRPQQAYEMLEIFPGTRKDAKLLTLYGTSALALEKSEQGVRALQQAIALDPKMTQAHVALALHYGQKDPAEPGKAIALLRDAYAIDSNSQQVATTLVSYLMKDGKTAEAEKIVAQQLQDKREGIAAPALAAAFYTSNREFAKAEQYYEQVLTKAPDNYRAALQLGVLAALQEKSQQQVLEAFSRAAVVDADRTEAYEYMLRTARNQQQLQSVEQQFRAIEEKTRARSASAVMAAYLSSRGEFSEAGKLLDALNDGNTDPDLLKRARFTYHSRRAAYLFSEADYADAKQSAFAALRHRPESPRMLTLLAQIEITSENYSEAEKIIGQIRGINEAQAELLNGDLLAARGNRPEALSSYLSAWKTRPTEQAAVKIYSMLEGADPAKAKQFLQQWLELNPGSVRALSLQSRDLLVKGQFSQAIPMMEQVQAQAPDNVTNLNNLAWAYQQTGNPKAVEIAKRAYELAPDTAAVADTYGWILYQRGDRSKAIEVLERAARLDSGNEEIAEHLRTARAGA